VAGAARSDLNYGTALRVLHAAARAQRRAGALRHQHRRAARSFEAAFRLRRTTSARGSRHLVAELVAGTGSSRRQERPARGLRHLLRAGSDRRPDSAHRERPHPDDHHQRRACSPSRKHPGDRRKLRQQPEQPLVPAARLLSDYVVPERVYQYSVSYQQELPGHLVGTVAYVGSQGRNLFLRSVANQILRGQATIRRRPPLPTGAGVVNITERGGPQVTRCAPCASSRSSTARPCCTLTPKLTSKRAAARTATTRLQTQLSRRFGTGLTMNAQYTFANPSGTTAGSNEARTAANNARAIATGNTTAATTTSTCATPSTSRPSTICPSARGKRFDWGGAATPSSATGRSARSSTRARDCPSRSASCAPTSPCSASTRRVHRQHERDGDDRLCRKGSRRNSRPSAARTRCPVGFVAVVNVSGGGASRNVRRPDLIPGVNPYLNNDRNLLNPAAFAIPAAGAFGNLPRNALRGPNFWQADLIFNKRIPITETVKARIPHGGLQPLQPRKLRAAGLDA
jgi:hypothetical protein